MRTRHFAALVGSLVLAIGAGTIPAAGSDPNNPTGTKGLILIDKVGRHVRFFDPATRQELSSLEVGVAPHDVAVSPDHTTAYVTVYGDGVYGRNPNPGHTIAIIDLASRQVTGTIDISPHQAPHGIQIDAAGLLYVSCDLSRKLLVIDPKTKTIQAAIDTEGTGHWVAVLPDGSKAYVTNKNDRPFVSVIDLKTRRMVGRVPAPKGTQGIAASPDGRRVVAVDLADPILIVIDPATDTVIDRVPLDGNTRGAFKPRYSPDGTKIFVCNLGEALVNVLTAADLRGKQYAIKVGKDPMGFAFGPDGRTALVANHGDGTVSIVDLQEPRVVGQFTAGSGIETGSYY